ncbi:hypothetical protein BD289DRAFT_362723, partial [Coniella lustricola]
RGWTLQELTASREVQSYGKDWEFLCTKRDLKDMLDINTKINAGVLEDSQSSMEFSVAAHTS